MSNWELIDSLYLFLGYYYDNPSGFEGYLTCYEGEDRIGRYVNPFFPKDEVRLEDRSELQLMVNSIFKCVGYKLARVKFKPSVK
jgi:hypothetical protein